MSNWSRLLLLFAFFLSTTFESNVFAFETRKWTILVYWAVDNDLYEFSKPYLRQFEQIKNSSDVTIVVEYDFPGSEPSKRYLVRHSDRPANPNKELQDSLVLQEIGEKNSADPATLKDFISFGRERFPAEQTLLVIGSHGSNWSGAIEDVPTKKYMSLPELHTALVGSGLDLVVFDACKMSFLETLLSMQGAVPYIAASPFDLNGFDHVTPLTKLAQHPHMPALDLAKLYIDAYPLKEENAGKTEMSASLLKTADAFEILADFEKFFGKLAKKEAVELAKLRLHINVTVNEDKDSAYDLLEVVQKAGEKFQDLRYEAEYLKIKYDTLDNGPVLRKAMTALTPDHSGLSITCADNLVAYAASYAGQKLPHWTSICQKWQSFSDHFSRNNLKNVN